MTNLLKPGKYVVAVSGGVDSIVLLDMLAQDKNLDLVVAHFDHGIRQDSAEDNQFVKQVAKKYGLDFFCKREELGANASEASARTRRYKFLSEVCGKVQAKAIVTAHHQDDVVETALLNTIRGTKRRGLISLKSTEDIQRPLLNMTKKEILQYADLNKLEWREDSTNKEERYKRNQIRKTLKDSLSEQKRREIIELLKVVESKDKEINQLVESYLNESPAKELDKKTLLEFETSVAYEIVAGWLRKNNVSFDTKAIKRIVTGVKSLDNGSQIDVQQDYYCLVLKDQIILKRR